MALSITAAGLLRLLPGVEVRMKRKPRTELEKEWPLARQELKGMVFWKPRKQGAGRAQRFGIKWDEDDLVCAFGKGYCWRISSRANQCLWFCSALKSAFLVDWFSPACDGKIGALHPCLSGRGGGGMGNPGTVRRGLRFCVIVTKPPRGDLRSLGSWHVSSICYKLMESH